MSHRQEFTETLYDAYRQEFSIDQIYYEHRTEQQHLVIFHNSLFGRVMALDGVIQTTERDEFIYHEMLSHVPILAHGAVRRVLIIGGGDGAMLREVCRHADIEGITMVEIDAEVVEMAKRYLPNHSAGAFDDPRLDLVISDGLDYVQQSDNDFDIIISDSTDPIGPGESLFTPDFYRGCRTRLAEGGIMVAQNGVAFMQLDEVRTTCRRLRQVFADSTFYSAAIPTYVGGIMTFAWGSDVPELRRVPPEVLRRRFAAAALPTRYYTPELHQAAFALPRYLIEAMNADSDGRPASHQG